MTSQEFEDLVRDVEKSSEARKKAFPDGIMTVQIHPDSVLAKVLKELDYDPLSKT